MLSEALMDTLPDLVVLMRRDGTVIAVGGGSSVGRLKPMANAVGERLETIWPAPVAELLKQLLRKAIAGRAPVEARFEDEGRAFEARVSAQGPDRAVGVIRATLLTAQAESLDATDERPRPQLDRRGFLRRFKESVAVAALREKQMAIAIIHVDGIADIGQVIAAEIAERVMSAAILRLPPYAGVQPAGAGQPWWYLGQLSESLLALVLETADRDAVEACVDAVLRKPARTGVH